MDATYRELLKAVREGNADFDLQLSIARGIYPLEAAERLEILLVLIKSREDVLRNEALATLRKLPRSLIDGVAENSSTPPGLLERMVRLFSKHEDIVERILLNPAVQDGTVAYVATLPYPRLLEIVGRNQARLDRDGTIMENLRRNESTPRTIISLWEEAEERRRKEESRAEEEDAAAEEAPEGPGDLPAVLVEEAEKDTGVQEAKEAKKDSIIQMLREMSAGERVAMAMKGNSEVRKVLIRDKNRLICEKVLENPRITDSEVESFAKSTNVSDDVLRIIGANREWSRQMGIMKSLVYNPKTPLGISMGFLKRMSLKDLEFISKSKNVPEALRRTARRMHKQKLEKRS
jgi:phosphoribosylformylglycinamidine (FGAM) synthase PurS component